MCRSPFFLLTAALLLGILCTPAFATTCTTTCSVSTLSCTPVTYCTSVPGTSLDCDGVVTTCTEADAFCTCQAECVSQCEFACELGPGACGFCMRNCREQNCGSQTPPPNTQCNI